MVDRVSISPYRSGYISAPSLEEENAILRTKCKKVSELQEKVELVLKHNSQLLVENEKLSKLLHQHKSELEITRNKMELMGSQRVVASGQDFEIKKLLGENQRLRLELAELEHLKAAQISETRSQLHAELQSLKRQHLSNTELYELEIRKLKDLLERKDYELEEAKSRVSRAFNENEFEIIRLREEKDRLRGELAQYELDRKKQADTVRSKLEAYYLSEIEAMKKTHLANLEAIEFENIRLKDSLAGKNQEIESLLVKHQKLKQNSDQGQGLLRNENQILRQKLVELERIGEIEFQSLKSKLQGVHESEIQLLRNNNQNFIACLQQEIDKLENLVNSKNIEMETLIKERGQTRQIHESEIGRMRMDAEVLLTKIGELEKTLENSTTELRRRIQQKEEHIDYLNELSTTQNNKHNQELDSLRKLLSHKDEQIEAKSAQNREVEVHLKESLASATKEADSLRDEVARIENQRANEVQDLKDSYDVQLSQLKEKLEGANNRANQARKEADMLRESLDLKEKEVAAMKKRMQSSDQNQKKLIKEIEDLRNKLLNKDKENNKIVEEQRTRLEKTFNYQLESLKADHANAIKSQKLKASELQAQIKKRDLELDDLLKKYKKLEEGFHELTNQEATKKELTLKFPGATADLMATKNLFDVYIKSKVLDLAERRD